MVLLGDLAFRMIKKLCRGAVVVARKEASFLSSYWESTTRMKKPSYNPEKKTVQLVDIISIVWWGSLSVVACGTYPGFHLQLILSWHQFVESLYSACLAYYEARQLLIMNHIQVLWSYLRQVQLRKFIVALLPFLAYLLIFTFYKQFRHALGLDKMLTPNLEILSRLEYNLFFCHPHRILSALANPVFDILAAIVYLIHFPLPFIFGAYLTMVPTKRPKLYSYMWCAGWVNLTAVLIQSFFPTSPPWFTDSAIIDNHGNIVYEHPSEAGFFRLDRMLGNALFHNIYSTSPLKFGAFPSLHVAWPMVIFVNQPWFGNKAALCHVVWIALAAVYSTHHYVVDAIGGILLVLLVKLCMLRVWTPFPDAIVSNVNIADETKEIPRNSSLLFNSDIV